MLTHTVHKAFKETRAPFTTGKKLLKQDTERCGVCSASGPLLTKRYTYTSFTQLEQVSSIMEFTYVHMLRKGAKKQFFTSTYLERCLSTGCSKHAP